MSRHQAYAQVVVLALLLAGCVQPTAMTPTTAGPETVPSAAEAPTTASLTAHDLPHLSYCNWIVISGVLAEEISHLPEIPGCAFSSRPTDRDDAQFQAKDLSQFSYLSAPPDAKGLFLAVSVVRPDMMIDTVDQATFARNVGRPVRQADPNQASQLSAKEIAVKSIYTSYDTQLHMTMIYVTAIRSSTGKRRLSIYFFRALQGELTDLAIEAAARHIITAELPLVESIH
jgi:hypothetical protein